MDIYVPSSLGVPKSFCVGQLCRLKYPKGLVSITNNEP
jgi:hypothetical protein